MPELPEVETTRRKIEPLLLGQLIIRLEHDAPHKYLQTHLAAGQRVQRLRRRGKYLIFELGSPDHTGPEYELIIHLGMTGGFRLEAGKHTRASIYTEAGVLHFDDARRFGKIAIVRPGEYSGMPTLAQMGPEPLSDDFKLGDFIEAAAQCGAVKPWLLSQKPVSGVGNIYADESLWLAQVHPGQTRLNAAQAERLYQAIRQVMTAAVEAGGSTLNDGTYQQHDGVLGLFQHEHQVYARAGQPCSRCGQTIEKFVLAGRGTHVCPACQPMVDSGA